MDLYRSNGPQGPQTSNGAVIFSAHFPDPIQNNPRIEPKKLRHQLKFEVHEVNLTCRGPWIILGTRSVEGHLKWTPKSIESGPGSEPKKLRHQLKFEVHEVHLTCRGPWIILGTRSVVGHLKWTPKSIGWDLRSEPKKLRHRLKFEVHEVHKVHLTCRGPWIILGTRSWIGHLIWTPKSIRWGSRSEPKKLRHF